MGKSYNIILAGFGGQGVLFAGKLIAYAGLLEGREVSWLPSYGPEMRGGTANCSICISDEPIGSPLVLAPDILVTLNQPSYDKFKNTLTDGGISIVDTTLVQDLDDIAGATQIALPISKILEDANLKGLANVFSVGKVYAETKFCSEDALYASIEKCVSARRQDMIDQNKSALQLGIQS